MKAILSVSRRNRFFGHKDWGANISIGDSHFFGTGSTREMAIKAAQAEFRRKMRKEKDIHEAYTLEEIDISN